MNRSIVLQGNTISYRLLKRRGIKTIRISFRQDRGVFVSAPKHVPLFMIEHFLKQSSRWIIDKVKEFPSTLYPTAVAKHSKELREKKEQARSILERDCQSIASLYGVSYNRISIRNQRSRWGSCSRKGNLNFHYKVAFLPEELRKYIVVHEICHLKQMNHSGKFWELVARVFPHYKSLCKELKKYSANKIW